MDFSEYDRIDDFELNEILWRAVKGKDAPLPRPSAGRSPIGRSRGSREGHSSTDSWAESDGASGSRLPRA